MSTVPGSIAARLFIGIGIFFGLPLLAWGLDDITFFFAHPVRFLYVVFVIFLQVITTLAMPSVGLNRGTVKTAAPQQRLSLLLLQLLPLSILLIAPFGDRREWMALPESPLLRLIGIGLFMAGMILVLLAEATLGRQFSVQVVIQEEHQLITNGLYRYLRHPRYFAIILFTIGLSLTFRSWLSLIVVAALIVVLLRRIQDEETLLEQEFGDDWRIYTKSSWRILPFVY